MSLSNIVITKVLSFVHLDKSVGIQYLSETILCKKNFVFLPHEIWYYMYSLKEAWTLMYGELPVEGWDGRFYCLESAREQALETNRTQGMMLCYTFNLVVQGKLRFFSNGREFSLGADDLYIYTPGTNLKVVDASDDLRMLCLLAEEGLTLETPSGYNVVRLSRLPFVWLHEQRLSLSHQDALMLGNRMHDIIRCIHSNHRYKAEVLRMLYSVFLLDLQNVQSEVSEANTVSQRTEDLFNRFMQLVVQHFLDHRDIAFYASQLNISSVYLSRVVRKVSGRTVGSYLNQLLAMEAAFLLRTTSLTVSQVADRLGFADIASFSKFFSRVKGISPYRYREQRF